MHILQAFSKLTLIESIRTFLFYLGIKIQPSVVNILSSTRD